MVRTFVVTGAAGFVGSALVQHMLQQLPDVRIRAQFRDTPLPDALLKEPGLELSQGELADPGYCEKLCEGADQLIHLAGYAHTAGSRNQQQALNLNITRLLASAAMQAGLTRFTYISSVKASTPAQSAYAQVKLEQENFLLALHKANTLQVSCLRPALIYGAGMKGNLKTLLGVLSRPRLPVFVEPSATIGLIGLDDCCRAIIASLECQALTGGCWQLDDGKAHDLKEMFEQARSCQGLAPPSLQLPRWSAALVIRALQLLAPLTRKAIGMGTYHSLYSERYQADTTFAELTGWTPHQHFGEELPQLIKSLQN